MAFLRCGACGGMYDTEATCCCERNEMEAFRKALHGILDGYKEDEDAQSLYDKLEKIDELLGDEDF